MTRRVPGGRGAKFGSDANVVQRESYDERVSRLPDQGGWSFGTLPVNGGVTSAQAFTANRLIYRIASPITRDVRATEARLSIGTTSAGNFMRAAIWSFSGDGSITKVAGSEVKFFADVTARQVVKLKNTITLTALGHYFIGYSASDGTLTALSQVVTGTHPLKTYYQTLSASTDKLPDNVTLAGLTEDGSVNIPYIYYLSLSASEVV